MMLDNIKKLKKKNRKIYIAFLLLFPFFTLIIIESIHRGSFEGTIIWATGHFLSFLVTYLFLLSFIGIFFIFTRPLFISLLFVQFFGWIFIAFASYKKFQLRGDYFSPFDIHLLKEVVDISRYFESLVTKKLIVFVLLMGILSVLGVWLLLRLRVKVPFVKRMIISIASVILLAILIKYSVVFSIKEEHVVVMNEKYEEIGFVGAFLTIRNQSKDNGPPKNYNNEKINEIIKDINMNKADVEIETEFQPNVIVILAEALWDPLLLENIEFEEDPIPYYRSLSKNHSSGELLTHRYGGGTIDTELEVLTGITTRLLPEGQDTYRQNIVKPIDSLAHVFKKQGYNTTAVHAFANWFYNRNGMYKWLGFEKFVSREFFNDPKYIGLYIDDHELMGQVLEELKMTEGPDFMQVATVASHGPYEDIRYEELPTVTKGDLSKDSEYILDLYSQLLKELDDSIKMLIEGIEELNEPTMVVIYGDHLPMLGEDYLVYKEAGYFEDNGTYEEYLKMYTTPLLVWDNYSNHEREDLRMTPNFLGSYILSHAKKEKSPIFQLTGNLYNQGIMTIPRKDFWRKASIEKGKLEDYKLLQYDSLFGSQYGNEQNSITTAESYFLGSEKMKIESATIKIDDNGKAMLDIIGEGFVFEAIVFIEGIEQKTTFISSSNIQSELPKMYVSQEDDFTIIVKVTDNINVVLAGVEFIVAH